MVELIFQKKKINSTIKYPHFVPNSNLANKKNIQFRELKLMST